MSKQTFIDSIKDGAIEGWEKFKILPSITIAQAILESNWGKSDLAVKANNIFGIKGDYNGRKYLHDTWEVDKEGKRFNSTEWFRHYPNIGTSVVDHGEFFTSTPWRSNNYKHVIGETDYKIAAQALSDAGYATDPKYADKLINIIETYNLNQWDKKKDEEIKMAKSVMIDPGHGGTDPGAIGFGVREKEWTLRISLYQYERLKELGAKVGITRTTDVTLDSVPRTNKIKNKYDVCISNHWNAFNGSARGIETIHSIFGGKDFATSIANALVKATGLSLRRVFSRKNNSGTDYYFMHRLTGSTRTVIVEYGFLDNATDHNWYKNNSNFIKAAEAVIEAVCKEIGITYKSPSGKVSKPNVPKPSVSGTLYKVQAGAFQNVDNAEKLHEKMENAGIDAFVIQENGLFKVQAGAYSKKANAEVQLKKVSKLVGGGFIVETGATSPTSQPKPKPAPKPAPKPQAPKSTGQTLHLPSSAKTWNIYNPKGPYTTKHAIHKLTPSDYGGLSYEIKGNPIKDVYLIDTSVKGRVAIYAGAETGATIRGAKAQAPKPDPKPTPKKVKTKKLHLPATAKTWRVYKPNGPYTAGNEIHLLTPSAFGGITYDILQEKGGHVYIINTSVKGKVAIYAGPETGAKIT